MWGIDSIAGFIKGLWEPTTELIDNLHSSDEEKMTLRNDNARIQKDVNLKLIELETKKVEVEAQLLKAQAAIITVELKHGSWMQKNWRPSLMYLFGLIIFNNYMLAPYLQAIFGWSVQMEIPVDMWDLIKIFAGGYVIGRSGEKISEAGGIRKVIKRIIK